MKKVNYIKGITLISLIITIVVLIILSSIAIYLNIGNDGIFVRSKEAKEITNKQEATDIINLKITTAQMNKYAEKQEMPTLKELSEFLKDDNEIAYVTEKSQIASNKYEVGENPSSIFTKLNKYPYEFEINSSLQLASIDKIKLSTNNNETNNTEFEIKTLTYADVFKETSGYVDKTREITFIKNNYLIEFNFATSPTVLIPSHSWTTFGVLKEEYCPAIPVTIVRHYR